MPTPPPRARIADSVSSTTAARDTLLDAAERRFARQGFAATTIKDIAAEAHLNSALLYYYFANKEDLYHAVLRRRITGLAADVGPALMAPVPPAEAIRRFVQAYVGFLLLHPDLPALMQREILDHAAAHALPGDPGQRGRTAAALRRDHPQRPGLGRLPARHDPVHAVVSILGQVIYAFMAQPIIQGVLLQRGTSAPDAVWLREFGAHAADVRVARARPRSVLPAQGRVMPRYTLPLMVAALVCLLAAAHDRHHCARNDRGDRDGREPHGHGPPAAHSGRGRRSSSRPATRSPS